MGSFALLGLLVVLPVSFVVLAALRGPGDALPFDPRAYNSLGNFATVLEQGGLARTTLDTVIYIVGSVVVALAIAAPLAWLVERTDLPLRRAVYVLAMAPFVIPPVISAQAWQLLLLRDAGIVNRILRSFLPVDSGPIPSGSRLGIVIVQGIIWVPLMLLFLTAALKSLDSSLEEASRLSGVSGRKTLWHITLKVLTPAVLGACLLLSVFLLGQFEIPLVFGLNIDFNPFGLRLYKMLLREGAPRYGEIAALAVLMVLLSYCLIFAYRRLALTANKYTTVTGKFRAPGVTRLGALRIPAFVLVVLYILIAVVLPFGVLLYQSVVPVYRLETAYMREYASLDAYRAVLGDSGFWRAARNTLVIATAAAAIVTLLGTALAWSVVRFRGRRAVRGLMDNLASSSLAVPGPVAAFAMFVLFLSINSVLPLYGTLWVLIIAYAFRVGVAYRLGLGALLQLSPELEEASAMSGVGPLRTIVRIVLPLLAPTVAVATLLALSTGVNEFAIPALLGTPETRPVSVYAYSRIAQAPSEAAAAGVITSGALLAAACLIIAGSSRVRKW